MPGVFLYSLLLLLLLLQTDAEKTGLRKTYASEGDADTREGLRFALDAVDIDFLVGYCSVNKCHMTSCYVLIVIGGTYELSS